MKFVFKLLAILTVFFPLIGFAGYFKMYMAPGHFSVPVGEKILATVTATKSHCANYVRPDIVKDIPEGNAPEVILDTDDYCPTSGYIYQKFSYEVVAQRSSGERYRLSEGAFVCTQLDKLSCELAENDGRSSISANVQGGRVKITIEPSW